MKYAVIMRDVIFCCELHDTPTDVLNALNEWDNHDLGPFQRKSLARDCLEDLELNQWHSGDVHVIEDSLPLMDNQPVNHWANHVILWDATSGFYFERCLSGDCGNCNCGGKC
ncbi:MAG: hypothetical protein WC315_00800 [Candidatus Omnitrophota bacterium]|jgi:hypothetical protein